MTTFFSWLENKSGAHQSGVSKKDAALFEGMEKIWNASACGNISTPDLDVQWRRLSAQMETAPTTQPRFRVSHALALAFVAVLAVWITSQFQPEGGHFTTQQAQTMTIPLPDQSTVVLSAQSNLTYEPQFNRENRNVALQGEAFFSVESGDHPFIIHAAFARVQVVGTRFNVHARNDLVEVSVVEGVVRVTADLLDGPQEVMMRAGETLALTSSTPPEQVQKQKGYSGWLDGQLDLEEAPASRVCDEIERRFDVKIRLADPRWGEIPVSGLFKNDPQSMVESLCTMLERSYVIENGSYLIQ